MNIPCTTAMSRVSSKPKIPKSLEPWSGDVASIISAARDAMICKELIFSKCCCDALNRTAAEVGSRKKTFLLSKTIQRLVRFYRPLLLGVPEQPVWPDIWKLSNKLTKMSAPTCELPLGCVISREGSLMQGTTDHIDCSLIELLSIRHSSTNVSSFIFINAY